VGFVLNKVALGQGFSEYFGYPCQFSFHKLLHNYYHPSSGAGTIGQLVADSPKSGGHPLCVVRLRTKATEFLYGGVRLSPLGTPATIGPIVPVPDDGDDGDDDDYGAIGRMRIGGGWGTEVLEENLMAL
jgi:hypothetical protein